MNEGKLKYCYNWVGLERYTIATPDPIPAGRAMVRFDFVSDGGRLGAGGTRKLYVHGRRAAAGAIEHTNAPMFSGDETADVEQDDATPVTEDDKAGVNALTGKIRKVTVELK